MLFINYDSYKSIILTKLHRIIIYLYNYFIIYYTKHILYKTINFHTLIDNII